MVGGAGRAELAERVVAQFTTDDGRQDLRRVIEPIAREWVAVEDYGVGEVARREPSKSIARAETVGSAHRVRIDRFDGSERLRGSVDSSVEGEPRDRRPHPFERIRRGNGPIRAERQTCPRAQEIAEPKEAVLAVGAEAGQCERSVGRLVEGLHADNAACEAGK